MTRRKTETTNGRVEQYTKLVAIYARVSTARQEEDGTVETQLGVLRDFARQSSLKIVKEFVDDGWSGDVLARPALDALRHDAKRNIWQSVLIYDPDRLARRYSYQELVMDELREAGVETMFVTVPAPKNSEEKILHGVRGLFAEYERAKIAERFRLGKLRKVKEGHVLVSEAPYGYDYVPKRGEQHGHYVVNGDEARTVRMMFEWVANEGLSLRRVVRRLEQARIRPRESKRGVWSTSTLSTLFRNTAYVGEARWGSSSAVVPKNPINKDAYRKNRKSSRRAKPQDEWIMIPVPEIIEKELFDRARIQLDLNHKLSKRNKKNEYLLAGKIRCVCGRTRAGEGPQHGKYLYYRCSDRVLSFPLPPVCKEQGINVRNADRLVWEKIVELMCSPELMQQQTERWLKSRTRSTINPVRDVAALRVEVAKLKEHEERYNKAYGAGLFTLDQLRTYTEPIRERIAALELQISNTKEDVQQLNKDDVLPSMNEIQSFADEARTTLCDLNFSQKRTIVVSTVEKVIATPRELQVYGYIPINHVEPQTIHRHGVNVARHSNGPLIPFELAVRLPPPLRRGIDYGFLPGTNATRRHFDGAER
jgi:site-specific DNA recombinase